MNYKISTTPATAYVIKKSLNLYTAFAGGDISYLKSFRTTDIYFSPINSYVVDSLVDEMQLCLYPNPVTVAESISELNSIIGTTDIFTTEQVICIKDACDLFARINASQFEDLRYQSFSSVGIDIDRFNNIGKRWKRAMFGLESNASLGVNNPHADSNMTVAWDIVEVLRNRVSWDANPDGGHTVNFDSPMHWDKSVPLVEINQVQDA